MDVVRKKGDKINIKELSKALGCPVVEISALKGEGIDAAVEETLKAVSKGSTVPQHTFSGVVEHALAHIEEAVIHNLPEAKQRFFAIKIFEGDEKIVQKLGISADKLEHVKGDIKAAETELGDDAESIITNERYIYIGQVIKACYKKVSSGTSTGHSQQ